MRQKMFIVALPLKGIRNLIFFINDLNFNFKN